MTSRAQVAQNRDIRAWAVANGVDLAERGRIPEQIRQQWAEQTGAPLAEHTEHVSDDGGALGGAPDGAPESGEVAPRENKRRWWPSFRGAREARERRKRVSTETLGAFAWGGLAQAAARQGRIPTARMLQLQAPVAGMLLDDAVKGTVMDVVLQPIARVTRRGEAVWALIGPPILVEVIMRHPERQALLMPFLYAALEQYAALAGPKLAQAKKRAERRREELGDQGIEELIQMLFAPPDGAGGVPDGAAA